ncbi:MAG: hypothetical protein ACLSAH_03655 [Bilophila wadsworthia]
MKCGGSDGFSGISANPAIGEVSDRVVTLGGGPLWRNSRAVRRGSQHDFAASARKTRRASLS